MTKKMVKNINSQNQYQQAIMGLEEFYWFLTSNQGKGLIAALAKITENLKQDGSKHTISPLKKNKQNIRSLIGLLPEFFDNKLIFTTNSDIEKFAREILGIKIINYDKKSRTEIIGVIICEVPNLDGIKFSQLVEELSNIIEDEQLCNQVIKAKNATNFSWNETIRLLF